MPATHARPILELVPDSAIWRPITRWVDEIIRALVANGRDPDPVAVLARAKHQAAAGALQPERAPHPTGTAGWPCAWPSSTPTPSPRRPRPAREVLDEAYRRAFRAHVIRMQKLTQCGAD